MALLNAYGDSDADPGEKFLIGKDKYGDKEVPVFMYVRLLPQGVIDRIENEFPGEMKEILNNSTQTRVRSEDDRVKIFEKKMRFALVGFEGPLLTVQDDKGAALFTKAMGREVKPGDTPNLANINDATKKLLFQKYPTLLDTVSDCLRKLSIRATKFHEAKNRNLSTGSTGE